MHKNNNINSANVSATIAKDISIKRYRSLKRQLKRLEQSNYNTIYAIPCNGNQGWHEMAEHSALIYYYHVVKKLNLKTKFQADINSFYDQYPTGFIRAHDLANVRRNLIKLDLLKSEHVADDIHSFKLKTTFTEQDLRNLEKQEHARRLQNLTPEQTENLDPDLHHLLATTGTRLHRICVSRLDRLAAQTNGAAITQLSDNLLENYHKLTMLGRTPNEKHLQILTEMRKDIYLLIIKAKVLGEVGLWDFELCASVSEPLTAIKKRIEANLKKIIKNANETNVPLAHKGE